MGVKRPCRHPAINQRHDTQSAKVGDQYAARHHPFVYFHSIIDDPARCATHAITLSASTHDLASPDTTLPFSFTSPNLCHDGHDAPCVDGQPGGLASADAFLQEWVPRITSSPAFADNGVLIMTFDEAEVGDLGTDARACCHEPTGPNTLLPGLVGPGGGRTGTVVLGPGVRPGTVSDAAYNHYSMRRVFVAGVLGLGIGALTSVGPARAGGSWLYPTGDSFQAGDNVTLVGYTGGGQLGWVDDGPFYAYLRVGAAAGGPSPSVMPTDVPLGPLTIEETGKGGYLTLRASLTFRVPAGLEPRRYDVVYCNDPCTTGLGDLVGGFVDVGVPAIAPIQRTWPPDDPAWALVATPPRRRVATPPCTLPTTPNRCRT